VRSWATLFWGTISDYIGRRTAFQTTVGLFAVFTGLVATSWNVVALGVFRFLSNFGLGGEVPVTLTLASEFSPGRVRGRMAGNIMAAFPVGLVIAAALSLFIIPAGAGGRCSSSASFPPCCCFSCAAICRNRCVIF